MQDCCGLDDRSFQVGFDIGYVGFRTRYSVRCIYPDALFLFMLFLPCYIAYLDPHSPTSYPPPHKPLHSHLIGFPVSRLSCPHTCLIFLHTPHPRRLISVIIAIVDTPSTSRSRLMIFLFSFFFSRLTHAVLLPAFMYSAHDLPNNDKDLVL